MPSRQLTVAVAAAALLSLAVAVPGVATAAPTDAELALRWAPVHYQDTDSSDYDADYLSRIDYDGEWDMSNNWEHQDDQLSRLTGDASYSVVQTSTHWFLVYAYYHPRDWEDFPDPFGQYTHENDLEGVLLAVRKDGSTYGKLEGMVTVAHNDFYSYVAPGSPFTSGRENVDGTLIMRTHNGAGHPSIQQEAKGHGIKRYAGGDFPGGDGVVYLPTSGAAEVPSSGNDRAVAYRLTDIFRSGGLWSRRSDAVTFASPGTFRGDNGKDNAANAPWGWDDQNDGGDLQRGLLATDPARLVSEYFDGTGSFSLAYTSNRYR